MVAAAIAAYLTVTVVPMVRHAIATHDPLPLIAHLVALLIAGLAAGSPVVRLRVLRDWLPLVLGPFMYIELRWLIAGLDRPHLDATVIQWERAIFPGDPSHTLALRFPSLAVSELLHACYLSYYALIFVPPALLYLRGRRDEFSASTMALSLVYLTCFTCFLLFPVDGPRFIVGPAEAPAGPIRSAVLHLLQAASSRGTAFPSSHVAASVVAATSALQHQRPVGYIVAALATGLSISTVYGGFHYGVDAVAGLVVGLLASGGAWWLCRAIPASASTAARDS
jgi:membrane-associated phospholipid phosphatase